ncbi:MlaD family protein [Nocardia goodfellowii]
MRTPREAACRLGLLLLVVIGIIILVVQAIARPVGGETRSYHAEFGDVFGLQKNADVRVRGVQVGKVTDIALTPQHRARVRFTLRTDHRLRESDRLAIKFQNLTGQRYVAVEPGDGSGSYVDPAVAIGNTVDSFDITTVFNGLRPLLNEADPAVYNRLVSNLAAVIEGNQHDLAPVLRDVAALASYADDRAAVLSLIVDNLQTLSNRLRGRSENLENILRVFHSIFMPVADRMDEFLSLMGKGSVEISEIVHAADALSRLLLGARDSSDDLTRRIHEAIPDPTEAVRSLWVLPGVLEGLNAVIPGGEADGQCSNGVLAVPVTAEVLLAGRRLTICNGSR